MIEEKRLLVKDKEGLERENSNLSKSFAIRELTWSQEKSLY